MSSKYVEKVQYVGLPRTAITTFCCVAVHSYALTKEMNNFIWWWPDHLSTQMILRVKEKEMMSDEFRS